jgi:hypothetical protein
MGLPTRRTRVWLGIARLARFRADGLEQFGHTPPAFLNSLAPLLAFPLVSGAMVLLGGAGRDALANVLVSVIALLAPAVISYYFAVVWQREALWLRYAIAFNWCEAAVTLAAVLLLLLPSAAMADDRMVRTVVLSAVVVLLGYWLVLHGFMARHGLRVSVPRAVLLVIVVNIGTGLLVKGPWLLASLIGFMRGG